MRRFLLFALAATLFVACTQDVIDEQRNVITDDNRTLTVSLDGDANDTRIQLNEEKKSVWTEGDLLSVFYRSTTNEQWQFAGKTGDRSGNILPVDSGIAPTPTTNEIVVVYPYNASYFYNSDTKNVQASLPAESGDDGEVGGSLVRPGTILTEVTLNCGAGVTLDAEATAFYIALPPMTLECGLTVDITATDGSTMTETTEKALAIERNYIQPMSAFAYTPTTPATPKPANNKIWYTATAKVEPYNTDEFGAKYLSNVWDSETGRGVITFEGDVTKIGYYAFYGYQTDCNKLTSVTIPDSVTTIGTSAFRDCTSLTSVTIPDSVTTIGNGAFDNCNSLTSVTIGNSVTTIGDDAFEYCTSLTSVTIPNSVTTIGYGAFNHCKSLTSVTIPNSVTMIGDYAFRECESLTSVTIGNSVTTIGEYAFSDCSSLTSVTIPDSVTTIGYGAFAWCESLTSVTIGDSVTTIGDDAFNGCDSLTSVTIGNSVTTIGEEAFELCKSLTSVTIPDSVTTIGQHAFSDCKSLKEFNGKFAADNGRCLIMDNTLIAYAEASGTTYTIPDSVTTIGDGAFYYCSSLTSVTIPNSVTTIGYGAFNHCKSLTSVTIPDSVTTIGNWAFNYCKSLTSVTIPDSITTIGNYAFEYCQSLTSVTIPDSVTTIGKRAFNRCTSLTSVTIPDSVTTIGEHAFWSCDSLTSVTIGNSVTTIGSSAFCYCESLKYVYCKPTTPPTGGYDMFYNNAPGRKILVPASDDDSIISAYKAAEYWSDYAYNIFEEE